MHTCKYFWRAAPPHMVNKPTRNEFKAHIIVLRSNILNNVFRKGPTSLPSLPLSALLTPPPPPRGSRTRTPPRTASLICWLVYPGSYSVVSRHHELAHEADAVPRDNHFSDARYRHVKRAVNLSLDDHRFARPRNSENLAVVRAAQREPYSAAHGVVSEIQPHRFEREPRSCPQACHPVEVSTNPIPPTEVREIWLLPRIPPSPLPLASRAGPLLEILNDSVLGRRLTVDWSKGHACVNES